jgi:hypothetical protein
VTIDNPREPLAAAGIGPERQGTGRFRTLSEREGGPEGPPMLYYERDL